MNDDMKLYYDYTISPLGELFYETVWEQLNFIQNKTILDFGSGFGFTSKHLAKNNKVTSIEMNQSMLDVAVNRQSCICINSGIEAMKQMEDHSFDVVICHLVLEFVENPETILCELVRVLKVGGLLSLVKHNKNGRMIQAIVQDYDLADAWQLLNGGFSYSSAFGDIKYYDNKQVVQWAKDQLVVKHTFGVRALASLHDDKMQSSEGWLTNMLEIEKILCRNQDYINISYFNHILLEKMEVPR